MGGKRLALLVALVVVIAACIAIIFKKTLSSHSATPPDWLLSQREEKIDRKTLQLITKTSGEWEHLGHDQKGNYKNPETGEFTMTTPIVCASCGEKIPGLEMPQQLKPHLHVAGPPGQSNAEAAPPADFHAAIDDAIKNYICPKCGKPAFRASITH
jgi:predicted RNA-binding Zn-ribbon protein involved in translation (DUF1610 family)